MFMTMLFFTIGYLWFCEDNNNNNNNNNLCFYNYYRSHFYCVFLCINWVILAILCKYLTGVKQTKLVTSLCEREATIVTQIIKTTIYLCI